MESIAAPYNVSTIQCTRYAHTHLLRLVLSNFAVECICRAQTLQLYCYTWQEGLVSSERKKIVATLKNRIKSFVATLNNRIKSISQEESHNIR